MIKTSVEWVVSGSEHDSSEAGRASTKSVRPEVLEGVDRSSAKESQGRQGRRTVRQGVRVALTTQSSKSGGETTVEESLLKGLVG